MSLIVRNAGALKPRTHSDRHPRSGALACISSTVSYPLFWFIRQGCMNSFDNSSQAVKDSSAVMNTISRKPLGANCPSKCKPRFHESVFTKQWK